MKYVCFLDGCKTSNDLEVRELAIQISEKICRENDCCWKENDKTDEGESNKYKT